MRLFEKLIESWGGAEPVPQPVVQQLSPVQVLEQRRRLAAAMNPENQARLAQAYATKDAHNRINQAMKTEQGSEALVAALRNIMRQG